MSEYICKAGQAVKCVHKRNVKPWIGCAYSGACIDQVPVTEQEHGQALVTALKNLR